MSNIIIARDPGIIAAEINYIKEHTKETIKSVIERAEYQIGEKLCEAKSVVPHGEWGAWLHENVEYSQSTAENLMNFYKEYGDGQIRIGDTWRDSETFGKLTFTQHLALLKIPYEEREEFVEENNVAEMSTRELQRAIKERDEEAQRREAAENEREIAEAQLRAAEQNLLDTQQQLSAVKSIEGEWQKQIDKLSAEKHLAETGEKNAMSKVEVLEKQLKDAQKAVKQAKTDLKKAQEHPEIPESMLEELRAQAEKEAAEKAEADLQKKLAEAAAALEKEAAKRQEAEEKLAAAQKQDRMKDPNLMAVQTLGQQLLGTANSINGHRLKAVMQDETNAKPINAFLIHLINEIRQSFGIKLEDLKG